MPPASPHAIGYPPADVLVIKPSSMGDVLHTLPAVHALKQSWPQSRFHWVVNPEWAPLLDQNPDLHAVIPFPRRQLGGPSAPLKFLRWCHTARASSPSGRFDLAIDFQGLLRSALIARGCRAGRVLGLSDAREGSRWFYHEVADVAGFPHAIDRYLALARRANALVDLTTSAGGPPVFPLPPGRPPSGYTADSVAGAVLLHPFSRGEGKSLPTPMIEAIARQLAPRPILLVGRGGPTGHPWPAPIQSLLDATDLPELIWLLRHAAGIISVDSGPMHLAAALPTPLLGLHTWSDPRKVGPWRPDAWVWKSGQTHSVSDLSKADPAWASGPGAWSDDLAPAVARWATACL